MKNAKRIYHALLTLYPRRFQKEFGTQIMQTFSDHYADIERSEGRVGMAFWLTTGIDEMKNIAEQHRAVLVEEKPFLKATLSRLAVSAAFFTPLYVVFYAMLIKVSLALPHPPVSGIGVIIALATLLVLPAVVGGVSSYVAASVLIGVLSRRSVRAFQR